MTTVPAFDHRTSGTPAADWSARIDALPTDELVDGHDHLLVIAAHPDDETLGAGGLISDAARLGARVSVVVASLGEASHPDSVTHSPAELARLREAEVRAAVRRLASSARLVVAGVRDGALVEQTERLHAVLSDVARDATVVVAPWRADGHPDHDGCGLLAARFASDVGARLLEYPIWAWHWGQPGHTGPLRDDGWVRRPMTAAARAAKAGALTEHHSQIAALSDQPGDEPILPPGVLAHFDGESETFRVSGRVDLPPSYFERLYAASDDPWQLSTGFYERRKRDLLIAALPRETFDNAFEPGCALGLNTVALAPRCAHLVAMDVSDTAVERTRERLAGYAHVDVRVGTIPADWPNDRFDLIVVSEIGYYLADLHALATHVRDTLTPDGVVVACHWRHSAPGYPSSAARVHAAIGSGLHHLVGHREDDFLLDVWSMSEDSVARSSGLLPDAYGRTG